MRPLARLVHELRTSAYAGLAAGDLAVLFAAFRVDRPGWSILTFVIVTAVLALLWGTVGTTGRLRAAASSAAVASPDATLERRTTTTRRVLIGLAPIAVVLAVLIVIAPDTAAVLAGVPAGIGAADLWMAGWLGALQRGRAEVFLRDVPASPFSGGVRPVYTRPMNDPTEET